MFLFCGLVVVLVCIMGSMLLFVVLGVGVVVVWVSVVEVRLKLVVSVFRGSSVGVFGEVLWGMEVFDGL